MRLQGASVVVTDPQAVPNARRAWQDLEYADTPFDAEPQAWRAAGWSYGAGPQVRTRRQMDAHMGNRGATIWS